uniref:DM domain-containing protein n=1 Tax=Denticeps clupeoides TaxID=299321 RepID=A0AAY4CHA5_9TELE
MSSVAAGKVARSPRCARCRNHGVVVPVKGHAGRCGFSRCRCWKCGLITERTRIMATQRRLRRAFSQFICCRN